MQRFALFLGFCLLSGGPILAQSQGTQDGIADTLAGLYVGEPVAYGTLTLFPLDNPFLSDPSVYRTIDELLANGTLWLTETVPQRQNILLIHSGAGRDQFGGSGAGGGRGRMAGRDQFGGGGGIFGQAGGGLGGGGQGRGFGRSFLLPEGTVEEGPTPFLPGGPRIVEGPTIPEETRLALPGTADPELLAAAEVSRALHTTGLAVPVFCLEEKRSAGLSPRFFPTFTLAPNTVRQAMLGELTSETQDRVWQAVLEELRRTGTSSPTRALAAVYEPLPFRTAVQEAIVDLGRRPVWNDHTVGLAAAVNGRLIALDIYVNSDLFRRMVPRLIAAHAVEAVRATPAPPPPKSAVYAFLKALATARRELQPTVALGQNYVLRSSAGVGEALVHRGVLIHASGFPTR